MLEISVQLQRIKCQNVLLRAHYIKKYSSRNKCVHTIKPVLWCGHRLFTANFSKLTFNLIYWTVHLPFTVCFQCAIGMMYTKKGTNYIH